MSAECCTHRGHLVRGNPTGTISARYGLCRCLACGATGLPDPETAEGEAFYA